MFQTGGDRKRWKRGKQKMRQGEKGGQRSSEGRRDEHTGEELGSV